MKNHHDSAYRYDNLLATTLTRAKKDEEQADVTLWSLSRIAKDHKSSLISILHIVWKITQNVAFEFLNFGILYQFLSYYTDLSGNTVWPQASDFQKLVKMDQFWHFWLTFVHSKCKPSSLHSQCWMRLFLWFSNTVYCTKIWSRQGIWMKV